MQGRCGGGWRGGCEEITDCIAMRGVALERERVEASGEREKKKKKEKEKEKKRSNGKGGAHLIMKRQLGQGAAVQLTGSANSCLHLPRRVNSEQDCGATRTHPGHCSGFCEDGRFMTAPAEARERRRRETGAGRCQPEVARGRTRRGEDRLFTLVTVSQVGHLVPSAVL